MEIHSTLDAEAVVNTIDALNRRIEERFPSSGLHRVAQDLLRIADDTGSRAETISAPNIPLRIGVGCVIAGLVVLLLVVPFAGSMPRSFAIPELVQVTEASINLLVLVGGAIFFLVTAETRLRRQQVLSAIHELRALAHVIDMHQLAKDPQRVVEPGYIFTASSPKEPMNSFQLSRYLDYCSELFSLTGKLAALYSIRLRDPVIIAAVNEVETLTTGLSRKVWQKIVILHSTPESASIINAAQ